MRPGDFSPGNGAPVHGADAGDQASMRPGDFSPGNPSRAARSRIGGVAGLQ